MTEQCTARLKAAGYSGEQRCSRSGKVQFGPNDFRCKQHAAEPMRMTAQADRIAADERRRVIQRDALSRVGVVEPVDMHLGKHAEMGGCYECELIMPVTRVGDARFCENCLEIALFAFKRGRA